MSLVPPCSTASAPVRDKIAAAEIVRLTLAMPGRRQRQRQQPAGAQGQTEGKSSMNLGEFPLNDEVRSLCELRRERSAGGMFAVLRAWLSIQYAPAELLAALRAGGLHDYLANALPDDEICLGDARTYPPLAPSTFVAPKQIDIAAVVREMLARSSGPAEKRAALAEAERRRLDRLAAQRRADQEALEETHRRRQAELAAQQAEREKVPAVRLNRVEKEHQRLAATVAELSDRVSQLAATLENLRAAMAGGAATT
jgi:hypothetical protein